MSAIKNLLTTVGLTSFPRAALGQVAMSFIERIGKELKKEHLEMRTEFGAKKTSRGAVASA